jgi:hypothetical protein
MLTVNKYYEELGKAHKAQVDILLEYYNDLILKNRCDQKTAYELFKKDIENFNSCYAKILMNSFNPMYVIVK